MFLRKNFFSKMFSEKTIFQESFFLIFFEKKNVFRDNCFPCFHEGEGQLSGKFEYFEFKTKNFPQIKGMPLFLLSISALFCSN